MKYIEFYNKFKELPLIDLNNVYTVFPKFDRRRLSEWQDKKYLKKITNNYYIFSDCKIDEAVLYFIANKIYSPSYVSLESALSHHNLIPEAVFKIMSISTLKKREIKANFDGQVYFSYQQIKQKLFFGYQIIKSNIFNYLMAEPEKALLDFLYFRHDLKRKNDFLEIRFNNERLKKILISAKLEKYLKIFDSETLNKKIKILKICST